MESCRKDKARLAEGPASMTSGKAAGSAANHGAGTVREGFRFDEAALIRWMTENIEGFEGPMDVLQFKGGQSNPTYRLVTPGRSYVLRRKPTGELAPGAHAIDREARVMSALGTHGYPVARVYGVCRDDAVIGSWFYVMEMVEGRIFWDAAFPEIPGLPLLGGPVSVLMHDRLSGYRLGR